MLGAYWLIITYTESSLAALYHWDERSLVAHFPWGERSWAALSRVWMRSSSAQAARSQACPPSAPRVAGFFLLLRWRQGQMETSASCRQTRATRGRGVTADPQNKANTTPCLSAVRSEPCRKAGFHAEQPLFLTSLRSQGGAEGRETCPRQATPWQHRRGQTNCGTFCHFWKGGAWVGHHQKERNNTAVSRGPGWQTKTGLGSRPAPALSLAAVSPCPHPPHPLQLWPFLSLSPGQLSS